MAVALGGGVAIGSLIVAHRTDRAYPDYVSRARVGDVSINPSISSTVMDAGIRTLPGVEAVHSNSLLFASVKTIEGGTLDTLYADDSEMNLQVRGSADGDFIDADRPAVTSGRLPSGDHEVFVSDDYRDALSASVGHEVHVGDTIPMAFWWGGLAADDLDLPPDQIISPIGVEQLRIAGFGRLSDEVLPDELYARERLIVSRDIAEQYGCAFDVRPDMTTDEATFAGIVPPDCATQFIYYSLQLGGPGSDLTSVRAAFGSLVDQLTTQLPPAIRDIHGYEYIVQTRADLDEAVRQTTRPTVTALTVFGVVAAMATLAVVGLLFVRNLRHDQHDQLTLLTIGATTGQRALARAIAPAIGAVAGLVGTTIVAAMISPIGPLGSVRHLDPSPGISLPPVVVITSVAVAAVALLMMIAAIAMVGARRTATAVRPAAPSFWRARLLARGNRPSMTTGVRATLGSNGSWANGAVLVGCVIAISAVTAAAIFGTNLSALVTEPQRYAWPWDAAVITNSGYGMTDTAAADATLAGDPAVESYAFYGLDSSIQINGHPMPAIYGLSPEHQLDFPIIEGRMPRTAGEAAIGVSTGDKFGIDIGDRVNAETPFYEPESVLIVGTAVLPSLGAFVADRAGLGRGIYVLPASPPTEFNPYPVSLTAIALRGGPTADGFVSDLEARATAWDLSSYTQTYTRPVRPPEIVNVSDMRSAPLVLGGVLAVAIVASLALSTAVSVRERRRELAVLRTLGFSRRGLYASVGWQVLSIIAIGLIGGIPLGVIAGRYAWSTFADQLGVVPRAEVSLGLLVVVVAGAMVLGALAAVLPARTAARVAPSDVLRSTT